MVRKSPRPKRPRPRRLQNKQPPHADLVTVAQLLMVGGYTPERLHEVMIGHPTLDEIVPAAIRAPRAIVTE